MEEVYKYLSFLLLYYDGDYIAMKKKAAIE